MSDEQLARLSPPLVQRPMGLRSCMCPSYGAYLRGATTDVSAFTLIILRPCTTIAGANPEE